MDDVFLESFFELLEARKLLAAEKFVLHVAEQLLSRTVVYAVALAGHALDAADRAPMAENESHHGTPRRPQGDPKATPRPAVVQWKITSESRGIGWGCNRKAL